MYSNRYRYHRTRHPLAPWQIGAEIMNTHLLWTYLHIVLFVYWLGADVGVGLSVAY